MSRYDMNLIWVVSPIVAGRGKYNYLKQEIVT